MAKDDILDPARARFYIWGAKGTADDQESVAAADSVAKPSDDTEQRWSFDHSAASSEDHALNLGGFTVLVQRVWAMSDRALQARATIGLAEHADKLSLQLAAMPPYEAVQLLRLIVRYRLFLEPELYEKLPSALMWLSFEARGLVDLLVEAAETGDSRLEFIMSFGMGHTPTALPGLGQRLLPILRTQGTLGSVTIIDALCSCDEDIAEPAVNALAGSRERRDIWSEALRRGVNANIKEYALKRAGMPSEVEQYWQDENDEDESPQDEGAPADP